MKQKKWKPRNSDSLMETRFHGLYELGKRDGTLKTEIPEEEIFSTTLHLMLAATTRYAVGLVYESRDPEKEQERLKEMLMWKYTRVADMGICCRC